MRRDAARQWDRQLLRRSDERQRRWYFLWKRCVDVGVAAAALVLFAPLFLCIAVLIKWDTPGPVFFVQERVGSRRRWREGKEIWEVRTFPCYKFRSMVHGADPSLHQAYVEAFVEGRVRVAGERSGLFKLENDPRVTRVGHFLRKLSLDELPQLFNVLRGEMSLVGPRPVPIYEAAKYSARHWERLTVSPGMTGLWQVKGRCQVSFEEMVRIDIAYIRQQSLWLDLKILLLTIPTILSGKGAN